MDFVINYKVSTPAVLVDITITAVNQSSKMSVTLIKRFGGLVF